MSKRLNKCVSAITMPFTRRMPDSIGADPATRYSPHDASTFHPHAVPTMQMSDLDFAMFDGRKNSSGLPPPFSSFG